MRELFRWSFLISLALLLPVLPFLLLGPSFEGQLEGLFEESRSPLSIAGLIVAALAIDIVLPVPSSGVSTVGGALLGIAGGTLASCLGMTIGAGIGFALGRTCGRPLVSRFVRGDDLLRIEAITHRGGSLVLILTRPIPVLAEAAVLLVGATGLPWRQFFVPVVCANVAISAVYSAFGLFAWQRGWVAAAVIAAAVLPIACLWLVRYFLPAAATGSAIPCDGAVTNHE